MAMHTSDLMQPSSLDSDTEHYWMLSEYLPEPELSSPVKNKVVTV